MSSEFRHFAGLAMIGLLADPEDRDGDREWIVVAPFDKYKVGDVVTGGVVANSTTPFSPPKNVRRETCTEAVARLACDQAEALISEIERRTQPS